MTTVWLKQAEVEYLRGVGGIQQSNWPTADLSFGRGDSISSDVSGSSAVGEAAEAMVEPDPDETPDSASYAGGGLWCR